MIDKATVEQLQAQGVAVPEPTQIAIGNDVAIERIKGPDTTIYPNCRLEGADLLISSGCQLGEEGPVVLEDCLLGKHVKVKSGYCSRSVLLDGATVGHGSHLRAGCLVEEQASCAHSVGLKQTILFPFVTLGSLVNFCDVLMAGGTGRRDHSEVGSSFVHFNFTPYGRHGDKATASLIGDVPRGVMLRSPRIFLGGQAGIVGPVQIDFGTVLAAGHVYRQDHGPNELVVGEQVAVGVRPFVPHRYTGIRRRLTRNVEYVANLVALWQWYQQVRLACVPRESVAYLVYQGAIKLLGDNIEERVRQLGKLAGYMNDSIAELECSSTRSTRKIADEIAAQRNFLERWPDLERELLSYPTRLKTNPCPDRLRNAIDQQCDGSYLERIHGLDERAVQDGIDWLQAIVGDLSSLVGQ